MADIDPAIMKKFEGFYNHYCPEDLPILHVVLTSYQGREDALLEKLIGKYGPWPVEGVPEFLPSAGPSVVSNKSDKGKAPSAHSSVAMKKAPSSVSSKSTAKSSVSKASKQTSKAPPTPASVHSQHPSVVPSEPAAAPPASNSKPPSVVAESVKSMKSNASKSSHGGGSVQKQPSVLSQHTGISKKSSHHSVPAVEVEPAAVSRQASIQQSVHSRQPSILSATVSQQHTGRPPSVPVSAVPTPAPVSISSPNDEALLENAQLRSEISELNRKLSDKDDELRAAKIKKKGSHSSLDSTARANQKEIQNLRERLMQAEEFGRVKDRMLQEARQENQKPQQDDAKVQSLLKAAFEEVTSLREAVVNKDEYIEKLEGQLAAARQAILAATQTGFESDVKLHHAKTALNTLIDAKPSSETPKRRSRHASGNSPGIQTPSPAGRTTASASATPYVVPNLNQDWNSPPPLSNTPSPHRNRRLSPARPKKY
eukprot:TRINITY_DN4154_c0_g1_i1.p1 TRINITY_DN4154_c0_g1~~TRINITY_DN4154_c0_g1_i1.p1  ORF type:complete len:483 (+),score=92.50 TRINITY_DN4154_c0_g1_i1:267-1715(+)